MQLNPGTNCGCCGSEFLDCNGCDIPRVDMTLTWYPGGGATAAIHYNSSTGQWVSDHFVTPADPFHQIVVSMTCAIGLADHDIAVTSAAVVGGAINSSTLFSQCPSAACSKFNSVACGSGFSVDWSTFPGGVHVGTISV